MDDMDNTVNNNETKPCKHERDYVSALAGGGGSAAGYSAAGLKCKLAIEWDETAAKVFKHNFPDAAVWVKDMWTVTAKHILDGLGMKKGELHLFDASPPCQEFSKSNNKPDLKSKRAMLFIYILMVIIEIAPMTFVIENTNGLLSGIARIFFNTKILVLLRRMNYHVKWKVVHANEHGCPQRRKRLYLIGVRNDIFNQFGCDNLFPDLDPKAMKNANLKSIIPDAIGSSPGQYQDKFRGADEPLNTMTRSRNLWIFDKSGRRNRPNEDQAKGIMGFPPEYDFMDCSENQIHALCGNAVSPKVSEAIGKHLIENVLTDEVLDWLQVHPYKDE